MSNTTTLWTPVKNDKPVMSEEAAKEIVADMIPTAQEHLKMLALFAQDKTAWANKMLPVDRERAQEIVSSMRMTQDEADAVSALMRGIEGVDRQSTQKNLQVILEQGGKTPQEARQFADQFMNQAMSEYTLRERQQGKGRSA